MTRPWGRTPVRAIVDGVVRDTSIWRHRKSDGALFAAPTPICGAKGHGDRVTVRSSYGPNGDGASGLQSGARVAHNPRP